MLPPAATPSDAWLQAVAPRDVVLPVMAVGAEADIRQRLTGQGRRVWPLAETGALRVRWADTPREPAGLTINSCP